MPRRHYISKVSYKMKKRMLERKTKGWAYHMNEELGLKGKLTQRERY